jgi:hypothetical protein
MTRPSPKKKIADKASKDVFLQSTLNSMARRDARTGEYTRAVNEFKQSDQELEFLKITNKVGLDYLDRNPEGEVAQAKAPAASTQTRERRDTIQKNAGVSHESSNQPVDNVSSAAKNTSEDLDIDDQTPAGPTM